MLKEQKAGTRSDLIFELQKKHEITTGMFECIEETCKSKKVLMKQLQTEDESSSAEVGGDAGGGSASVVLRTSPILNFYTCLNC